MQRFKKAEINSIISKLIKKVEANQGLSLLDTQVLIALINDQLSKWCALESYWNIPISSLVIQFKEDTLSDMGMLDLYSRLITLSGDPHAFRWIKPQLQTIVKNHLIKDLPENEVYLYEVVLPEFKDVAKEDRPFDIEYNLTEGLLLFKDSNIGEDQTPTLYTIGMSISDIYS